MFEMKLLGLCLQKCMPIYWLQSRVCGSYIEHARVSLNRMYLALSNPISQSLTKNEKGKGGIVGNVKLFIWHIMNTSKHISVMEKPKGFLIGHILEAEAFCELAKIKFIFLRSRVRSTETVLSVCSLH